MERGELGESLRMYQVSQCVYQFGTHFFGSLITVLFFSKYGQTFPHKYAISCCQNIVVDKESNDVDMQVIALIHTLVKCPAISMKHCLVLAPLNAVLNWVYEWHKWLDKRSQLKVALHLLYSVSKSMH